MSISSAGGLRCTAEGAGTWSDDHGRASQRPLSRHAGPYPGGICYRVDAESQRVCFVGDTLFAGSIGRSNPSTLYQTHLHSVRTHVLGLPPEYRLLPGHGPATTVREELDHNPFASDH